jgi:hypothetical protein
MISSITVSRWEGAGVRFSGFSSFQVHPFEFQSDKVQSFEVQSFDVVVRGSVGESKYRLYSYKMTHYQRLHRARKLTVVKQHFYMYVQPGLLLAG